MARLGDRTTYTITDLPICNECGVNTQIDSWIDRCPSEFDICGKKHAEGEMANRTDTINIETYKCGTCIGDWAEEDYDETTGEWDTESKWAIVEKEIEENHIPRVDALQPFAKEWRKIFNFDDCGYGHADLADIEALWNKTKVRWVV